MGKQKYSPNVRLRYI